ncbi:protein suppressor of underreplication [Armigeres subalbatus]|uniref:protein suppressor of underreplication n=1 Tax=Armigeres subalbatus TaxID=124917 RepID=UPI002ED10879
MDNDCESAAKKTRFALREALQLGDGELCGSLVEILKPHQLEGIRFIYRGLKQNKGVILNDESGLGKTHQIIGYLSATIGPADKIAILCNSLQRLDHWLYHLELLTAFETLILDENCDKDLFSLNPQIILSTFDCFQKHSDAFATRARNINLVVIDESKDVQCEIEFLALLAKLLSAPKIFVITENLLDNPVRFSLRLRFCHVQFHEEALKGLLTDVVQSNRPLKKLEKLKLFFLTRSVSIRRYRSHHKKHLPLIEKSEFQTCFGAWKIANGMDLNSQNDEVFEKSDHQHVEDDEDCETTLNMAIVGDAESSGIGRDLSRENGDDDGIEAANVAYKISEPLFEIEQSTEEMPQLVVESSDSETKSTLGDMQKMSLARSTESEKSIFLTSNIEIPETERTSQASEGQTDSEDYIQFGQALIEPSTQIESSSEALVRKTFTPLTDDNYDFPIDRFLQRKTPSSSSTDLEIVSKESVTANNPVLVSSCSSNGREKSPDLFSDSEDDTVKVISQDDSLMKLLFKSPVDLERTTQRDLKIPKFLPKFPRTNVSTPISKLIHGPLQDETANSSNSDERPSSNDIFADLTVKNPDPNRTDVFEITDNNAFGNKILVHAEKDSMSPLRDSDDVQFVSVLRPPDGPIEIVDLDTDVCTPKSQNGPPPEPMRRTTPSSKNSLPSTPRGWLTKSNRSSDSDSPRTPKTTRKKSTPQSARRSVGSCSSASSFKRKKLENWFRDAPTDDEDDFEECRRASMSVNRRRSAPVGGPGGSGGKRISPRKKCFQERIIQRYNQILVSPSGMDSDFE